MIARRLSELEPDLVHAWGVERGAALVASRLGYPYLVTMQGLLSWIAQRVKLNLYQKLETALERPSLKRARIVTAESAFAVSWLREKYPHLEVHQVEHAPDSLFQSAKRQPNIRPPHFLYVGHCSYLKGTDLLIAMIAHLRAEADFRLTVAGSKEPGIFEKLRARFPDPALWERIRFLHGLSPAEVSQELSKATIFLFPSRADNSPNAVKEAVVAGVPIVGSAVGGIVDYVHPGLNGFTFVPGDAQSFLNATRATLCHPLFSQGQVDAATLTSMRGYLAPSTMRDKFLGAYRRTTEVFGA